jgi:hypothetical protein
MDAEHSPEGSGRWWLDQTFAPALVARVVHDIDNRRQAQRDILVSDLLCAAWPTARSQMQ